MQASLPILHLNETLQISDVFGHGNVFLHNALLILLLVFYMLIMRNLVLAVAELVFQLYLVSIGFLCVPLRENHWPGIH